MVRTADEFWYTLTPATASISLQNLREGLNRPGICGGSNL